MERNRDTAVGKAKILLILGPDTTFCAVQQFCSPCHVLPPYGKQVTRNSNKTDSWKKPIIYKLLLENTFLISKIPRCKKDYRKKKEVGARRVVSPAIPEQRQSFTCWNGSLGKSLMTVTVTQGCWKTEAEPKITLIIGRRWKSWRTRRNSLNLGKKCSYTCIGWEQFVLQEYFRNGSVGFTGLYAEQHSAIG